MPLVLNSNSQWLCWKCQPDTSSAAASRSKSKGAGSQTTAIAPDDVQKQELVLAKVEALLETLPPTHFASIWGSRLRSIRLAKETLRAREAKATKKGKPKSSSAASSKKQKGTAAGSMPVIWDLQRHYTAEGTQLRLTHLLRDEPDDDGDDRGSRAVATDVTEWDAQYQQGGSKCVQGAVPRSLMLSRVQQFLEQGLCVFTPGLAQDQVRT